LVLTIEGGNWLEWANDGEPLGVSGRLLAESLVLTWFVSGPDYDTVFGYRKKN
jgi:hypothetical protein